MGRPGANWWRVDRGGPIGVQTSISEPGRHMGAQAPEVGPVAPPRQPRCLCPTHCQTRRRHGRGGSLRACMPSAYLKETQDWRTEVG